ncbi:MAG: pyridoxamine 5'-phosphate oxidase [Desulfuromonadales bacterium]
MGFILNGAMTPLRRASMDVNPISQFTRWLQDAELAGIALPNAMTLATATPQGRPSARMVLLKGVDEQGFVLFTNYASRKALELLENPLAALVFCWLPLSRQVRVEGTVEPLEANASDQYFASRPRGYQIEAHASPQSQVIQDRGCLERRFQDLTRTFDGREVPRPPHWGGYRLIPDVLEFWQEGEHRLHDRLRYRRVRSDQWLIERLAP